MENKMVEYRKKFGLSQEKLAEKLGVSRQTIISIEKGKY
ncbi:helix-turn-helix domain-containing protein, partial [Bacillus wiedmannii]